MLTHGVTFFFTAEVAKVRRGFCIKSVRFI